MIKAIVRETLPFARVAADRAGRTLHLAAGLAGSFSVCGDGCE